jgi:hypothetical protein
MTERLFASGDHPLHTLRRRRPLHRHHRPPPRRAAAAEHECQRQQRIAELVATSVNSKGTRDTTLVARAGAPGCRSIWSRLRSPAIRLRFCNRSHVRVRGGPRPCRCGVTVDRLSWENVKTTECAVPAFSMDLATRVRARRPADLSSGSAIGTATQRHGSGSRALCREAHLLDVAAGGNGVGCRPPVVAVA